MPLEQLTVAEASHHAEYVNRRHELFGDWADLDRDGCDTREEVLQRDLVDELLGGPCKVVSGAFADPYTGIRGPAIGSKLDIDHVVSLSDAWRSGAWSWSRSRRVQFSNDLSNLIATNLTQNRRKGDQGPADWRPPNPEHHCEFARTIVQTKITYQLTVTEADREALARLLSTC